MAHKHQCGNCYSAALYVQEILRSTEGLRSDIIAGNVPEYFMRNGYKGICHAAVYVPEANAIIDSSVYGPPMLLGGTACHPAEGTIMRDFADTVRCREVNHNGQDYIVTNRLNKSNGVKVPGRIPHIVVSLEKNGQEMCRYDYVLAPVIDFDNSVTVPVHTVNTSLFRTTTDEQGRFKHKIQIDGDVVTVFNYITKKKVTIPLNDVRSDYLCKLCPSGIMRKSHYCVD